MKVAALGVPGLALWALASGSGLVLQTAIDALASLLEGCAMSPAPQHESSAKRGGPPPSH